MIKDKSTDVLNFLILLHNDRIAGYKVAFKETNYEDLKFFLSQSIQTSKEFKSELMAEIEKLGEQPDDITRSNGKIFRAWMDFKSMVLRKDRRAFLGSCEYSEYVALHTYKNVLWNDNLGFHFNPFAHCTVPLHPIRT
jgi:uncharacterized protein (TIGR02284 family)